MKLVVIGVRKEFKRIKFIQAIREKFEPDLKKAKNIADSILSNKKYEIAKNDLDAIERIGNCGLDLYFSYWEGDEYFEGTFDSYGLSNHKVQTQFSLSEIEDCLKHLKSPVLAGTHRNNYQIFELSEIPSMLLIENEFLADQCVEYLLSKGTKVIQSIKEIG